MVTITIVIIIIFNYVVVVDKGCINLLLKWIRIILVKDYIIACDGYVMLSSAVEVHYDLFSWELMLLKGHKKQYNKLI